MERSYTLLTCTPDGNASMRSFEETSRSEFASTGIPRTWKIRLYDISAQRRPVTSFDFQETPIKAVAEDLDGYTIYLGNGSGDLATVNMCTGKLIGSFFGKMFWKHYINSRASRISSNCIVWIG